MMLQTQYEHCLGSTGTDVVAQHAELVRRIAHHLSARLPASVDVEDLVQSGMVGLIEAARKFDSAQGVSFESFASARIRGAMVDEIRRGDWAPRSVHRKSREASAAIRRIEQQSGRAAQATEVAQAIGLSLDDYSQLVGDAARSRVLSLESQLEESGESTIDGSELSPQRRLECTTFREQLVLAIADLPEREKLMLSLYYQQELNLREIGLVLGVTESRACQIHGQAMLRLRARLADWQGHPTDELLA
jgi:RNA polymerase sigma factor for flagellar operon FliA